VEVASDRPPPARAQARTARCSFAVSRRARDAAYAARCRLTLTLVSSDTEDNALRQLGESVALFSHFACGASIFGKAAKFKAVMRRARVTPTQTIAIGDEVRDIEAARAAGIACGAATWGYSATDALIAMKPDMVFQNMNDISARLAPP
jgi:phosphoglycolate phosphatase